MRYILVCFLMMVAPFAKGQEIVVGLSDNEIGIDTFFDGSELFVYGAIRPRASFLQSLDDPHDVIITISSPREPVTVRRKDRRFGIWVNVDAAEIDMVPHFYAVATTGPFDQVITPAEDARYAISVPNMIQPNGATNQDAFYAAVQRIKADKGLYVQLDRSVDLRADTLFSTSITLPANLIEGTYDLRIFIARDGHVVGRYEGDIAVQK
ncbi:MAG: TIGR02186 family protein, partial [Pseudomonadota bacterium]